MITKEQALWLLKVLQLSKRLKDTEIAERLGMERGGWNKIKNGKVPISDKFLVRAHRAFPELGIFS